MRLWDPSVRSFDHTRALTSKRPMVPAAVPLFSRGRARVIALDFDCKHLDMQAVDEDVSRLLGWLRECGGRAVIDRSASGGRHVLIPLAPGVTVSVEEVRPLLDQLSARLPTLDIVPMCNASTGCITVPGSQCREGGYRRLEGELDTAIDTLIVGSEAATVPRLLALLGGHDRKPPRRSSVHEVAADLRATTSADRIVGTGVDAHLHPRYCRPSTPTKAVRAFTSRGVLDKTRWDSRSEARQSVIAQLVVSGASVSEVVSRTQTPEWAGFRAAYSHYRDPQRALQRDARRALEWAASTMPEPVRDTGHKFKYTGGHGEKAFANWLRTATSWVTAEYAGRRDRWSTHAVVQALAWCASVAGEMVEGVPVVAVGGRSLSIAAGMLPESTVWSVLERLRETEGSPLLLVERGVGQNADRYALVGTKHPNRSEEQSDGFGRLDEVESVHPVWSVLGFRQKAVYEVVLSRPGTCVESVIAAVRIGRSSGYDALSDLRVAGLIEVGRDHQVQIGAADLDQLALQNGLDGAVRNRIVRHRAERIVWRQWLSEREEARVPTVSATVGEGWVEDASRPADAAYLDDVVASGPAG